MFKIHLPDSTLLHILGRNRMKVDLLKGLKRSRTKLLSQRTHLLHLKLILIHHSAQWDIWKILDFLKILTNPIIVSESKSHPNRKIAEGSIMNQVLILLLQYRLKMKMARIKLLKLSLYLISRALY
jgi:hypothetical protein